MAVTLCYVNSGTGQLLNCPAPHDSRTPRITSHSFWNFRPDPTRLGQRSSPTRKKYFSGISQSHINLTTMWRLIQKNWGHSLVDILQTGPLVSLATCANKTLFLCVCFRHRFGEETRAIKFHSSDTGIAWYSHCIVASFQELHALACGGCNRDVVCSAVYIFK